MSATPSTQWINSSQRIPCPICGRTKDGDCRISGDGQHVICHRPKDLRPGEVINGWAFTGNTSDGRGGHFTPDKPQAREMQVRRKVISFKRSASPVPIAGPIELAQLPESWPEDPPAHLPDGYRIDYSPTQWTEWRNRTGKDGNRERGERPRHRDGQSTAYGAGTEPWPLFGSHLIALGAGKWIAAAEGPKCAMWLQAGGCPATIR